MVGKKFQSLKTQEVVKIDQMYENIAILDNGDRVSVQRLLDKNYFEEFIDPQEFLSKGALDIIANKIKSIPDDLVHKLRDERESDVQISGLEGFNNISNESAIVLSDPEEEKRRLLEKYSRQNINQQPPKINRTLQDFLEEEPIPEPVLPIPQKSITVTEAPKESPEMLMFKGVKRTYEIEFITRFLTHIPRLDFIEMMEDSYEYSIIDWLSEDITSQILSDRELIKKEVKNQIIKALETRNGVSQTPNKTIQTKRVSTRKSSGK